MYILFVSYRSEEGLSAVDIISFINDLVEDRGLRIKDWEFDAEEEKMTIQFMKKKEKIAVERVYQQQQMYTDTVLNYSKR